MKILIVSNNLQIGGVQKALVNLLWQLPAQYQVTLLLFYPEGPLAKDLPPNVELVAVRSAYRFLGMNSRQAKSISDRLGRSFFAAVTRLLGRKTAVALMALTQKPIEGFDAAISYLHNGGDRVFYGGCNAFVLRHVRAQKKIAFLHCDYLRCGANTRANARHYAQFDRVAACSQGCAESFRTARPELADRVSVVCNCHRFEWVRAQALAAPVAFPHTGVNVVTVARLGREKGVGRALEAIAQLSSCKSSLRYYVIGDGIERKRLQALAKTLQLEETVTLCGEQSNPYGFMAAADLLLIPSVSEAAPLVVWEAACLGTPVLSAETSSAREQIEDTGCGWVCENSVKGLAASLGQLLQNRQLLWEKRAALRTKTWDDRPAVQQFEQMLEDVM